MRHTQYLQTFDWDWSDGFDQESARGQALKNRPQETRILSKVCQADSILHFALWSKLPTHHPVAELWLETQADLHSSIYLAYGGYFRQAIAILRLWLEMAVNGVYFSKHFGQPTGRYELWRSGQRHAPADMRKISDSLAKRPGKLLKADFEDIRSRLEPLYSSLCHHVHGQGLDLYSLQKGRDNVPRFLEQSFDLWCQSLVSAFNTICYLYRVFFSKEIGDYLRESKSENRWAVSLGGSLESNAPDFQSLIREACAKKGQ
jgi:hypothetical protein